MTSPFGECDKEFEKKLRENIHILIESKKRRDEGCKGSPWGRAFLKSEMRKAEERKIRAAKLNCGS